MDWPPGSPRPARLLTQQRAGRQARHRRTSQAHASRRTELAPPEAVPRQHDAVVTAVGSVGGSRRQAGHQSREPDRGDAKMPRGGFYASRRLPGRIRAESAGVQRGRPRARFDRGLKQRRRRVCAVYAACQFTPLGAFGRTTTWSRRNRTGTRARSRRQGWLRRRPRPIWTAGFLWAPAPCRWRSCR